MHMHILHPVFCGVRIFCAQVIPQAFQVALQMRTLVVAVVPLQT